MTETLRRGRPGMKVASIPLMLDCPHENYYKLRANLASPISNHSRFLHCKLSRFLQSRRTSTTSLILNAIPVWSKAAGYFQPRGADSWASSFMNQFFHVNACRVHPTDQTFMHGAFRTLQSYMQSVPAHAWVFASWTVALGRPLPCKPQASPCVCLDLTSHKHETHITIQYQRHHAGCALLKFSFSIINFGPRPPGGGWGGGGTSREKKTITRRGTSSAPEVLCSLRSKMY